MESHIFEKAEIKHINSIWNILQQGIEHRKKEGSKQWQDGYPNPEVIKMDIDRNVGYILKKDNEIIAYVAIIENDEPNYQSIDGKWLSNEEFIVVHRLCVAEKEMGNGFAKKILKYIEEIAISKNIKSIKMDTNFDNGAMLHLLSISGYTYCGEITLQRGGTRKAFEKIL